MHVFRTGQPPPPRQPPAPAMSPAIEIFRVEVFVWRVGPTPREGPTEVVPAEPATPAAERAAAVPVGLPEPVKAELEPTVRARSVADDAPAQPTKPSRRRRGGYQGAQRRRARVVLRRLFPKGYPTEEEVSNPDAWVRFCREYERVEAKSLPPSKLGRPSQETMLREMGRQD